MTGGERLNMNKVILLGRLTRDPEVRYSQSDNTMAIARYTLAVERRYKNASENSTDFISCVCFGKTAEFAEKYLHQGTKIIVEGRIQTGSYTNKDNQKVYTTEVVVENSQFTESKRSETSIQEVIPEVSPDGFMSIPQDMIEGLPFN